MKQPVPFIIFLLLQCLQFGTPIAFPADVALSHRSEFGGDIKIDDGTTAVHDGQTGISGAGKQWAADHPTEGTAGTKDTDVDAKVDKGDGTGPGKDASKPGDNNVAADGNEIVQLGKTKAELDKATNSFKINVEETCFAGLRRRSNVLQPRIGGCFSTQPKEVIAYNKAWTAFDKSASQVVEDQVNFVHAEIVRRLEMVEPKQIMRAFEHGDLTFSELKGKPDNPALSPSFATGELNEGESFVLTDVSPIKQGPVSPDLWTPMTFNKLDASDTFHDAAAKLKDFSGEDLADLYKIKMKNIQEDPAKTIQDQINLQSEWQEWIEMPDLEGIVRTKTGTVDVGAQIAQAKAHNQGLLAQGRSLGYIYRDGLSYDLGAPSKLGESWWNVHDREIDWTTEASKKFESSWKDYVDKQTIWTNAGKEADAFIEKRGGLPVGTLTGIFKSLPQVQADAAAAATAGTRVGVDRMVDNTAIRIRTDGNQVVVSGIPLSKSAKIKLAVGTASFIVIGGSLAAILPSADGTNGTTASATNGTSGATAYGTNMTTI